MKLFKSAIAATVALGAVASGSAIAAEKKINAITSLQPTNVLAKAFLQKFVAVLNKSSKGIVSIKYVGRPYRFTESPWDAFRAPLVGEHTKSILSKDIGYSEEDLNTLAANGIISY